MTWDEVQAIAQRSAHGHKIKIIERHGMSEDVKVMIYKSLNRTDDEHVIVSTRAILVTPTSISDTIVSTAFLNHPRKRKTKRK